MESERGPRGTSVCNSKPNGSACAAARIDFERAAERAPYRIKLRGFISQFACEMCAMCMAMRIAMCPTCHNAQATHVATETDKRAAAKQAVEMAVRHGIDDLHEARGVGMGGEQDAAPELPEETGKKRKRRGGDQRSRGTRRNITHGKRGNGGEGNRGDT